MKIILNNNSFINLYLKGKKFKSRQKLDEVFIRNELYIFSTKELLKKSIYLKKMYLSLTKYFNVNIIL